MANEAFRVLLRQRARQARQGENETNGGKPPMFPPGNHRLQVPEPAG